MDPRLKRVIVLAREHYERREYARAEPLLKQVIDAGVGYADVHNMLGVVLHERGDFVTAASEFERAAELNPSYTEALLNLVIACNDIGQYERAREVMARVARARAPTGDQALDEFALGKIANMHADLAQAYADAGCASDAVRELERAIALRPGFADLRVRLAGLHRDAGRLAEAQRELEAACESHPAYAQARVQLGVVLLALGDTEGATRRFGEALEIEPEHRSARMYLRIADERVHPPAASPVATSDEAPASPSGPFAFDDDPTHIP